jgi:serine/threonine protein kinase
VAEWLETFHARVFQYRSPGELFGRLPRDDRASALDSRRAALLAGLAGQGQGRDDLVAAATHKIDELTDLARAALEAGTYDADLPTWSGRHTSELRTALRTYRVIEHLAEGEHADVYRAEYERDGGVVEQVAIKIPRSPALDDASLNESRVLGLVAHKSLPIIVDTFRATSGAISTITRLIDGVDLHEVRERYPTGVPQVHLWWILDRLLSVLGFLHSRRVIHGAIEPGNVMLRPRDHNAFLLDFLFAVVDPLRSGQGYKTVVPGFSAPEVAERRSPAPPADLFALGATITWLAGGEVDEPLRGFLQRLVEPDPLHRPRDAWDLCRELRLLRDRTLGTERSFVELVM